MGSSYDAEGSMT